MNITLSTPISARSLFSARSLSFTLALALISLSVVALLVSNSLQMASNWQVHARGLAQEQQSHAHGAAIEVRTFLEMRWNTLMTASKVASLANASAEQRTETLERLLVLDPLLEQLVLLDDERFVVATASQNRSKTVNFLDPALIDDIMQQTMLRNRYVSSLRIDAATGEPGIVLALPLVDAFENYHGALIATINARLLWETMKRQTTNAASLAYIVDRQGNLLACSDVARVLRGENAAHVAIVQQFTRERSTSVQTMHYTGLSGVEVVGSYEALSDPAWAVVIETPRAVAYAPVIADLGVSGLVLVGAIIASGGIGVFLARWLMAPLVDLTRVAERIAAGERDVRVAVGGPREIQVLARAFSTMTAQLEAHLETLEQRVAQRTADLQAALAEVETKAREQARLLEEIAQQRQVIRELSVPVLPVTDDALVMPLIGAIDTERLADIQDRALHALQRSRARYLLVDITGVPVVDSQVAQGLIAIASMCRLLGAGMVLIGIRPEVAQTIVGLGLNLSALRTAADLQTVLRDLAGQHDDRVGRNGVANGHRSSFDLYFR